MNANKRDTSRKRESILHAAMQAFSNEGYDKASMDRIAEIAGASKRTVYNHFSCKEKLFQAVIEKFAGEMLALKQIRYDGTRSLEEQLSDFAEANLAVANNPTLLKLSKVVLTVLITKPELVQGVLAQYANSEDALVPWLRKATEDGRMTVDDPQLAARVFHSMIEGAFIWPAVYQGPLPPNIVETLKKELIETFLCRYGT